MILMLRMATVVVLEMGREERLGSSRGCIGFVARGGCRGWGAISGVPGPDAQVETGVAGRVGMLGRAEMVARTALGRVGMSGIVVVVAGMVDSAVDRPGMTSCAEELVAAWMPRRSCVSPF